MICWFCVLELLTTVMCSEQTCDYVTVFCQLSLLQFFLISIELTALHLEKEVFIYTKKFVATHYFMHIFIEGQKIMHNYVQRKLLKGFHVIQARCKIIKTDVLPLNLP